MNEIIIRDGVATDWRDLTELFTKSVHEIAAGSYSKDQIDCWAPMPPNYFEWEERFETLYTLVADIQGRTAGFISLLPPNHIEFLFTGPSFVRSGVATALYNYMLEHVKFKDEVITTDASLEARPFFEEKGWSVIKPELVERNGVQLKRFKMKLYLSLNDS